MAERISVLNPDVSQALTKAFGLQGQAPGELDPRIQVGAQLVDLEDQQYRWLARTGTFCVGDSTPINVARVSVFQLASLPIGSVSSRISRIRYVILNAAANLSVSISCLQIDQVLPVIQNQVVRVPGVRDSRMVGAQVSCLSAIFGTSIAGFSTAGIFVQLLAGAAPLIVPVDMTLALGGALYVAGATINLSFNCSVIWDERIPVSAELR